MRRIEQMHHLMCMHEMRNEFKTFFVVKSNGNCLFCIHRYKCEVILSESSIVYFLDWTELDDIR